MSQSRRTAVHPPVLSTEAHAATEAAFLKSVTALAEPRPLPDEVTVPDSPASLWTSAGRSWFSVSAADESVPTELRDWVAPAIVVSVRH